MKNKLVPTTFKINLVDLFLAILLLLAMVEYTNETLLN